MKTNFSLILFLFSFCIYGQSKSLDTKKVAIWKGFFVENTGNKVKVRVNFLKEPYFKGYKVKQIINLLKSKKSFQVHNKFNDELLGNFSIIRFSVEARKINLIGKVSFFSEKTPKTTNYYIAEWKFKKFYLEPDKEQFDQNPRFAKSIFYNKKEMMYIPAGEFLYGQGDDSSQASFNPYFNSSNYKKFQNTKAFYIDKHEVTNEEYAVFLKKTKKANEYFWKNSFSSLEKKHHPVINLTYREAEEYAIWAGKRLPTEIEWEKSARGVGFKREFFQNQEFFVSLGRAYPFGNHFDAEYCNTKESGLNNTISVYDLNKNSASPWGVLGMCGNASEWTSSSFRPYSEQKVTNLLFGNFLKVIRGGSFSENKMKAKTFYRDYGGLPNLREDRKAGIRLVLDMEKL